MDKKHSELFECILSRNEKESERILERIVSEEKIDSEWKEGYRKALNGLLLTLKSNSDKYLYFSKKLNEDSIQKLGEEFKAHTENSLRAEYDRGYFSALLDYVNVVGRIKPWKNQEG